MSDDSTIDKIYRGRYLSFRVSKDEKETIQGIADKQGTDVSTYLRNKALEPFNNDNK